MDRDILKLLADMLIKQDQQTEEQKRTNERLDIMAGQLDRVIDHVDKMTGHLEKVTDQLETVTSQIATVIDIMQEQNKSIGIAFNELKGLLLKQNELDDRLRKVESILFKAS